ncbi:hypothetical protein PsAD2_00214 [Pseudovibrio axinellae]|uniref:Serine protease n=1 Tax=Pseudovibrio axinellae TaxID=989403 RepID=A0A166B0N4_9HYPH|nr:serine protease [Pseudovibrio axinellae]KZL21793.1 hypothetical protein PsAD2_00214 [Pseudovibrio axinellae]SEQ78766.1 endonuclease G [Pseudovibrio axinellae]
MTLKLDNLNSVLLQKSAKRLHKRRKQITETKNAILAGTQNETDSKERLALYEKREASLALSQGLPIAAQTALFEEEIPDLATIGKEALIGLKNDLLPIEFFEYGLYAARSVGRLEHSEGLKFGTGFLVGQGLMMTNHHVLQTPQDARSHFFELGAEANRIGNQTPSKICSIHPEKFFWANEELDVAIVAVVDEDPSFIPLEHYGWHVLTRQQGMIKKGDPVNIIQHPLGRNKAVVVHNSHLLHIENETDAHMFCWYSGDTQKGASGSPVFNNHWEVVAVHHMAVPKTNTAGEVLDKHGNPITKEIARHSPHLIAYAANEGIRTSRIVSALEAADFEKPSHAETRDNLLNFWARPGAHTRGLRAAVRSSLAV